MLPPEECLFHIIPVPHEKIVAYGGGAGKGPAAILDASQLLETFDGTSCPSSYGICTHKAQYGAECLCQTGLQPDGAYYAEAASGLNNTKNSSTASSNSSRLK